MEQYTLIPAYRDTYYEYSGDSLSFFIQVDGDEVVFQGNAVKGPNEDSIRININRIAKDYLSQSMPDFRDADGTILRHPEAFRIFRLYRNDGILLRSYGVLFDWEGEFGGEYPGEIPMSLTKILSDPIRPNVSADMILPITVFGGFSGGTINGGGGGGGDCPACDLCSQLDGFDGRYLFFRGTGNFINDSGITAYTADEEYSTTAVTTAPVEFPSAYSYDLPSDPVTIFFRRPGTELYVSGGDRLIFPESVKVLSGYTGAHISSYGDIGGRGIETIANVWFFHSNVKRVWFPSLKKVIGLSFSGCTQLNEVCLPSVEEIGGDSFKLCTSLKEINLPSCYKVGGFSFSGCTNLETVNISFSGMHHYIDSVDGTDKIEGEFGQRVFKGCSKLSSVTFENLLYYNDQLALCGLLEEVNMPKLEFIGAYGGREDYFQNLRKYSGFYGCNSLKRLYFPSLTRIEGEAFPNCSDLEEIGLPYVERIDGADVFTEMSYYEHWQYPTFGVLPSLHHLELPNLRQLGKGMVFSYGLTLEDNEITLPNLEFIGDIPYALYDPLKHPFVPSDWEDTNGASGAFIGSTIKKVYLPKIKVIVGAAFGTGYDLPNRPTYVYMGKSIKQLGSTNVDTCIFGNNPSYITPSGCTIGYEGTKQEWISGVTVYYHTDTVGGWEQPIDDMDFDYKGVKVECSDGTLYFRCRLISTNPQIKSYGYLDDQNVWYEQHRTVL